MELGKQNQVPQQPAAPASLDDRLIALIRSKGGSTGLPIAQINGQIKNERISTHPEKIWRAYLLARPGLFICDSKGPEARVRLKRP